MSTAIGVQAIGHAKHMIRGSSHASKGKGPYGAVAQPVRFVSACFATCVARTRRPGPAWSKTHAWIFVSNRLHPCGSQLGLLISHWEGVESCNGCVVIRSLARSPPPGKGTRLNNNLRDGRFADPVYLLRALPRGWQVHPSGEGEVRASDAPLRKADSQTSYLTRPRRVKPDGVRGVVGRGGRARGER